MSSRDSKLLQTAHDALRVYWPSAIRQEERVLYLDLPVLDSVAEVQVSVLSGVFTVRSQLPPDPHCDLVTVNNMNLRMPEASFCYLLDDGGLILQSKLVLPGLPLEDMRPPVLGMAWQAGWQAARSGGGPAHHTGPSSYDHFVYLADLLSAIVHEHWHAQQRAAQIMLED